MNNIQKYIDLLKSRKENAKWDAKYWYEKDDVRHRGYVGMSLAFSFAIEQAELLLLKDESKQPQPPDFANTMLGEVPPVVNDGTEEISKAVEGATPVVRQNAQTKEVCPFCKSENTEQIEGINYCCNNCESTWANW